MSTEEVPSRCAAMNYNNNENFHRFISTSTSTDDSDEDSSDDSFPQLIRQPAMNEVNLERFINSSLTSSSDTILLSSDSDESPQRYENELTNKFIRFTKVMLYICLFYLISQIIDNRY